MVDSLARPGGNLTGLVTYEDAQLYAKRLSLLKQADPRVSRVAFMTSVDSIDGWAYAKGLSGIAAGLGIVVFPVRLEVEADIEPAFERTIREGANGVFMDSELSARAPSQYRIVELAKRARLPLVCSFQEAAKAGAMIVYDADRRAPWTRVSHYIDRILRGANPGVLPMERAGPMRLTVNVRTARDIGLELPKPLLRLADEVLD